VRLEPADVEVGDVLEAREGEACASDMRRRLDCVVREVQARLAAWLHRWGAGRPLGSPPVDCSLVLEGAWMITLEHGCIPIQPIWCF
jgi:hypothetical protein